MTGGYHEILFRRAAGHWSPNIRRLTDKVCSSRTVWHQRKLCTEPSPRLRGIFFGISIAPFVVLFFGNLAASVFFSLFCPSGKHLGNRAVNIRVESFKDDISNNIIEAFNKQFKYRHKTRYGFNSFESANSMIMMFVFFYSFIRPHSSLSNLPPAEVAGISMLRNAAELLAVS